MLTFVLEFFVVKIIICFFFQSDEISQLGQAKASLLSELDLADHNINSLLSLMSLELPYSKAVAAFKPVVRKNTQASSHIKKALKQLESVIVNSEALGVKVKSK